MVVLEVPKMRVKICLTFSNKDFDFWYFSCICEVTSKVVQCLSQFLLYSKNKKFFVNPFSTNASLLCSQKTSENNRFSDVFSGYRGIQEEHWLEMG